MQLLAVCAATVAGVGVVLASLRVTGTTRTWRPLGPDDDDPDFLDELRRRLARGDFAV